MASINCTEIRKGMVVRVENQDFLVVDRMHITPGNWRGMVQMKLKNMKSGSIVQKRFGSTEKLETVFLEQKPCQYLFQEGKDFVFMDKAQHTSGATLLESVQLGDIPGVGMVMIDGIVRCGRSRNTPPATEVAVVAGVC